jgi:hypothetical protein
LHGSRRKVAPPQVSRLRTTHHYPPPFATRRSSIGLASASWWRKSRPLAESYLRSHPRCEESWATCSSEFSAERCGGLSVRSHRGTRRGGQFTKCCFLCISGRLRQKPNTPAGLAPWRRGWIGLKRLSRRSEPRTGSLEITFDRSVSPCHRRARCDRKRNRRPAANVVRAWLRLASLCRVGNCVISCQGQSLEILLGCPL